jgi:hypothetical protein
MLPVLACAAAGAAGAMAAPVPKAKADPARAAVVAIRAMRALVIPGPLLAETVLLPGLRPCVTSPRQPGGSARMNLPERSLLPLRRRAAHQTDNRRLPRVHHGAPLRVLNRDTPEIRDERETVGHRLRPRAD